MKKRTMIFLWGMIWTLLTAASPLSPEQKKQIVAEISQAVSSVKTMQCQFAQTKYMSMLNDKMVSKGEMYYSQPSKLRWEYLSPYTYLFVFNGSKVYVGNSTRKNVIDTASNKLFREIAGIMMSTVTGKALDNPDDFAVDIQEAGQSSWNVILVPKKKEMKRMFDKVVLAFHRTDNMISSVDIYEKNGDKTEIRMSHIKKNIQLDESHFAIPM